MSLKSCADSVNGFRACDIGIRSRSAATSGCLSSLVRRYVACEYWSVRIFVFKFSTKGAFRVFNAIMKLV